VSACKPSLPQMDGHLGDASGRCVEAGDLPSPPATAGMVVQGVGVSAARATELSRCIARFYHSAMLAETGNWVSCPGSRYRIGIDTFLPIEFSRDSRKKRSFVQASLSDALGVCEIDGITCSHTCTQ
jgi:hypothetical protein